MPFHHPHTIVERSDAFSIVENGGEGAEHITTEVSEETGESKHAVMIALKVLLTHHPHRLESSSRMPIVVASV